VAVPTAPGVQLAGTWRWAPAGLAMLGATAAFLAMTGYVWRRRSGPAGPALALVLLATLLWTAAYAAELGTGDLAAREAWGDLKYVGICLLPPAWFAFAAQFSGRRHWLRRRNLVLLAIEPVVVLALLALPATHDLIRYLPPEAAAEPAPVARPGPLFWAHLAYTDLVLWASAGVFVVALLRATRAWRRASLLLVASLIVPWVLNLLYNVDAGPFGQLDLSPFAFLVSAVVVVWGLFRFRLLDITPIARSLVFETITDGVIVLDPLRRVVDANPAAEGILGARLAEAVGRPLATLLPAPAGDLVTVGRGGSSREFEQALVPIPDRSGPPLGWLVVLRDVTRRRRTVDRLRRVDRQRRELLRRLVTAREEERRQLAGDIQDDAIQALAAVAGQLRRLASGVRDPGQAEVLASLRATVTEGIGRLRQLVLELQPPLLEELRTTAYRIGQEALANVRSHAHAERVAIRLEDADGGLLLRITDDGAGFLPSVAGSRPGRLGLLSMREQAEMAGGWCRVASAPGMGTTVEVWLPLPTFTPPPRQEPEAGPGPERSVEPGPRGQREGEPAHDLGAAPGPGSVSR
jgi:signal transduction histidine kinase